MRDIGWVGRREVMRLLGAGGAALEAGLPTRVYAAASKTTLVLGLDISDTINFDPAREAQYTPPLSLRAAYESLVTMSPGDYLEVKPALAASWASIPDGPDKGKGWRFTLAEARFASGTPVTAEDVRWTFQRLINLKDQPSQYVVNVERIAVIDPKTIDLVLK
ncbi:MAG: ABC transporter substrate-binding protein, partial [Acetobacteraceae bacterium]